MTSRICVKIILMITLTTILITRTVMILPGIVTMLMAIMLMIENYGNNYDNMHINKNK